MINKIKAEIERQEIKQGKVYNIKDMEVFYQNEAYTKCLKWVEELEKKLIKEFRIRRYPPNNPVYNIVEKAFHGGGK